MVGIAKPIPNVSDRIKRQDDNLTDIYSLMRIRHLPVQRISLPILGTGSTAPINGGNFLKTEGDTMVGPIAFFPNATTVSSGQIDIGRTSGKFTSYIIVLGEGSAADDLDTILNAAFSGQELFLQAVSSTAITLKSGTGNIVTPDTADFVVAGNNIAHLIFDPTVGSGVWRVVGLASSGGGGSGANTALSNLTTTSINMDLLPQALGTLDLGSGALPWDNVFAEQIRLQEGTVSPSNAPLITRVSNSMVLNVATGQEIQLFWNGVQKHDFAENSLTTPNIIVGDGTSGVGIITLNDATTVAGINGQFYREGSDVKVFSGGAERDLSSIGAAGGADVNLSNLASPTAINQTLLPNANVTFDLGSALASWDSLWTRAIRFDDDLSVPTGSSPHRISTSTNGMDFNVDLATDKYTLYFNGVSEWDWSTSTMTGANIILENTLTLNDNTADPASNGQFARNGTDVKVFTGGAVLDFSAIANDTLSNLGTTQINAGLVPDTDNTHDIGSSTNRWRDVFTHDLRIGASGAGVGGARQVYGDADGVTFNTPTATKFFWDFNNSVIWDMSNSTFTGPNIILSNTLTLNDNLADPAANGQFARNGTDVKVFTGGVLKNLTNIGSGSGVSLPIAVDIDARGNVSGTQTIDLSLTTAHRHTMTLIGDVDFTFTNAPSGNLQFTLDIKQDATGGRSISFNDTLDTSAVQVKQAANDRTIIIVETLDSGTTFSTYGSALTPTAVSTGNKWSDPVNSNIIPDSNNIYDLGSSGAQFKDIWIDNDAHIDNLIVDVSVASSLIPQSDATYDLGFDSTTFRWRNMFISGSATIGANAEISGNLNINGNDATNQGWAFFGNDIPPASVPTPPSAETVYMFLDDGTGELSVKKTGGGTVSLEASGAGGDSWGDPVDANIIPDATANNRDLGSTTNLFNNIWTNGLAVLGSLSVGGTSITAAGNLQMNGRPITQTGDITPTDSSRILGASATPWASVFATRIRFNASTQFIDALAGDMNFAVATGEGFDFSIGGSNVIQIQSNGNMDFNGNTVFDVAEYQFDNALQRMVGTGTGIEFRVPDNDEFRWYWNNNEIGTLRETTGNLLFEIFGQAGGDNVVFKAIDSANSTAASFGLLGADGDIRLPEDTQITSSGSSPRLRLFGGLAIQADSSVECGFSVSNTSFTVGTEGTMKIPTLSGSPGTKAAADTDFGNIDGCIGIINAGTSSPTLIFRANGGQWFGSTSGVVFP